MGINSFKKENQPEFPTSGGYSKKYLVDKAMFSNGALWINYQTSQLTTIIEYFEMKANNTQSETIECFFYYWSWLLAPSTSHFFLITQ